MHGTLKGQAEIMQVEDGDLVFVQNDSMTDAYSLGSMTAVPAKLTKAHNGSWTLWEKLAQGRPAFGNPPGLQQLGGAIGLGFIHRHAERQCLLRRHAAVLQQRGRHRRLGDVQRLQLVDVYRAGAPAALCQPAGRRAGVLGLRAVPRPHRQLCRQSDGKAANPRITSPSAWPWRHCAAKMCWSWAAA
jgi:MCRA family